MACNECNKGKCDLAVGVILGQPGRDGQGGPLGVLVGDSAWPEGLESVPPGGGVSMSTTGEIPSSVPTVSSNCMFGPPTETVCQRRVRQVAKRSRPYTFAGTLGIDAPEVGYSPYQAANLPSPIILVTIPSEDLTACVRVCEIALSVARVLVMGDPPTYIIGTAGQGVAVGSANLRSSWLAQQNNVAQGYSTANGSKFGSRLISLPGHCNCDCIFGFGLWDLAPQLEFEYPGAFTPLPGDIITLSIQVERTYVAAKACAIPDSCGQPVWAPATNTVP